MTGWPFMQRCVHSVKSTKDLRYCLILPDLRGTCNGQRRLSFSGHRRVYDLKCCKDDGPYVHGSNRDASVRCVQVCISHQQVMQDELIPMGEAFCQTICIKDAAWSTKIMKGTDLMCSWNVDVDAWEETRWSRCPLRQGFTSVGHRQDEL